MTRIKEVTMIFLQKEVQFDKNTWNWYTVDVIPFLSYNIKDKLIIYTYI